MKTVRNAMSWICVILSLSIALSLGTIAFAAEDKPATEEATIATNDTSDATNSEAKAENGEESQLPAETSEGENTKVDTEETSTSPEQQTPSLPDNLPARDGKVHVMVNGNLVVFDDVEPMIKDSRTLIPMRKVGEAMNATVAWRSTDRTVHIFRDGKSIMLTIGKNEMVIRNFEFMTKFIYTSEPEAKIIYPAEPDAVAQIINSRTMVPIRAIAENMGAQVLWDDNSKTVIITIPEYKIKLVDRDAAEWIEDWNFVPTTELKPADTPVQKEDGESGSNAESEKGTDIESGAGTETGSKSETESSKPAA